MKILHISVYPPKNERHSASVSGVNWYAKNLVINIPYTCDDTIYVLCEKLSGRYENYTENRVEIIRCFDRNYKFVFQILNEIYKIRPDIIHIQQELALYGNIVTALLLQWMIFLLSLNFRVLTTLHGVVSIKKIDRKFIRENNSALPVMFVKVAFRIIYTPICWYSNIVIVHENCFKNILISEYKVRADKVAVIPLGIENFQAKDRNESLRTLAIAETCDVGLFMGYLTGYKGLDLLIEGFSKYSQINPNAFLIIGAGKHPKFKDNIKYLRQYQEFVTKAKALIPEGQYRWVGFISEEEVGLYYSASDVSIYPYTISMSSSGPMAIAIAYEKPFLASNVFSEMIENKLRLFEQNPQSLCDKLDNFFMNKNAFRADVLMYKRDRLWSKIGDKTRSLYSDISGKA